MVHFRRPKVDLGDGVHGSFSRNPKVDLGDGVPGSFSQNKKVELRQTAPNKNRKDINMSGILAALIGIVIVILVIEMIILALSSILWIYKIILKCLILSKGGEDGWKGLIPFYSTYLYNHLGFAHKTAVLFFIMEMVASAVYTVIYGVYRITDQYIEVISQPGSSTYNPYSLYAILSGSGANINWADTTVYIISFVVAGILILLNIFLFIIKGIKNYAVSKAFGMETGFCICAIFLPVITNSIIAFNHNYEHMEYCVTEFIPEYK